MSAFHLALADFLRKQQAELAIAAAAGEVDLGADHKAACIKGQEAFDRLFAMPAENASQAAAKLAALASYYEVPADTGCGRDGWGQLVAEVSRFSIGQTMTRADDAAASATIITAWDCVRKALAEGRPLNATEEPLEMLVLTTPALSHAGVRAKLLLTLDHLVVASSEAWAREAIRQDDLTIIYARANELDFEVRLIVSAIQALEGMSA